MFRGDKMKHDVTYHKTLKYGLVAFLIIIVVELLAYAAFFRTIPNFLPKYFSRTKYAIIGAASARYYIS